jgi:hypothetical protein
MAAKAKSSSGSTSHVGGARKKRPGVHSKKKCSKSKRAKNYKKLNVGQGK